MRILTASRGGGPDEKPEEFCRYPRVAERLCGLIFPAIGRPNWWLSGLVAPHHAQFIDSRRLEQVEADFMEAHMRRELFLIKRGVKRLRHPVHNPGANLESFVDRLECFTGFRIGNLYSAPFRLRGRNPACADNFFKIQDC